MAKTEKWNKRCKVTDAEYLGGHKLHLWFNDGLDGVVDLSDLVTKGVFKNLKNTKNFTAFALMFDTVVWMGKLDLAPEYLYQRVYDAKKGKKKHGFNYFNSESWESQAL